MARMKSALAPWEGSRPIGSNPGADGPVVSGWGTSAHVEAHRQYVTLEELLDEVGKDAALLFHYGAAESHLDFDRT